MNEDTGKGLTARGSARLLSLHFKLIITAAVTIGISLATIAGILVERQTTILQTQTSLATKRLLEQLIGHGELYSEDLAAELSATIDDTDAEGLALLLDNQRRRDSDIAAVFLLDHRGGVLALSGEPGRLEPPGPLEAGHHRLHKDHTRSEYLEIAQSVTSGTQSWGSVLVRYDLRGLARHSESDLIWGSKQIAASTSLAVGLALLVGVAGLVLSSVITRRLLRPIDKLARDAELIAEGDLDHEIHAVDSKDEFGMLARRFELMRRSIKKYVGELVIERQKAEAATAEEQRLRSEIQSHSQILEIKVRERTFELEAINQQLQEYDRLKSEFLSNVSHELRSPLAAISSAAKIISRYGDANKNGDKQFSSVIIEEARRLGRLIDDLLDLAKIEAGRVEWAMETIDDAAEILDHISMAFGPMFDERGIALEICVEQPAGPFIGDRDRLIQVAANLCSNAMKYTPPNGRVRLIAGPGEVEGQPGVMFAVQDNGLGIPANQLEHIFERFHQVKESINTNKPKGTGLGLAICREVVAYHSGKIWAEAADGGGAKMIFVVPLTQERTRPDQQSAEIAPPPC